MALFCASAFVIFHFALGRNEIEGAIASGVLWVTLTLAALLGIGRSFVADREEGGLDGFLLAPVLAGEVADAILGTTDMLERSHADLPQR